MIQLQTTAAMAQQRKKKVLQRFQAGAELRAAGKDGDAPQPPQRLRQQELPTGAGVQMVLGLE